jgi:DNA polymerase-1
MGQCLLIDGNNIVFRAYYAMEGKGFRSRSGQPTGALFGFVRMLVKLLRERKPDLVAVAFDVSRDTFRRNSTQSTKPIGGPHPRNS